MAVPVLAVVHVNMNGSDLDCSLRFCRDALALSPRSHTRPLPQDGRGFGLEGPAVDLLGWKQPRRTGSPYAAANHLGLYRLGFLVEDAQA